MSRKSEREEENRKCILEMMKIFNIIPDEDDETDGVATKMTEDTLEPAEVSELQPGEEESLPATKAEKPDGKTLYQALLRYRNKLPFYVAQLHFHKTRLGNIRIKVPSDYLFQGEGLSRFSSGYTILSSEDISRIGGTVVTVGTKGNQRKASFAWLERELYQFRKTYFTTLKDGLVLFEKRYYDDIKKKLEAYSAWAVSLHKAQLKSIKEAIAKNLRELFMRLADNVPNGRVPDYSEVVAHLFEVEVYNSGHRGMDSTMSGRFNKFVEAIFKYNKITLALDAPELEFSLVEYPFETLCDKYIQRDVATRVFLHRTPSVYAKPEDYCLLWSTYGDDISEIQTELFSNIDDMSSELKDESE